MICTELLIKLYAPIIWLNVSKQCFPNYLYSAFSSHPSGMRRTRLQRVLELKTDVVKQAFLDARIALDAKDDTHAVANALRRNFIQ